MTARPDVFTVGVYKPRIQLKTARLVSDRQLGLDCYCLFFVIKRMATVRILRFRLILMEWQWVNLFISEH